MSDVAANRRRQPRPIDAYMGAVRAAVPGPRGARADLLAELRDGLTDAADAYHEAGLCPVEAERRAVADSGDAAEVAAAYRAELTASQGRRSAMLFLLLTLASAVAWSTVEWYEVVAPDRLHPASLSLSALVDGAGMIGAAGAVLILGVLVAGARLGVSPRPVVGALVLVGTLSIATVKAGAIAMNLLNGEIMVAIVTSSWHVTGLLALSVVVVVAQAWTLWRAAAMAYRADPSPS